MMEFRMAPIWFIEMKAPEVASSSLFIRLVED